MTEIETILALLDADERNRYLRRLLSENDYEITFRKIDGSVRTMPCTLRSEAMPERVALDEHHSTKVYKPDALSVWCLDRSEWRSFRVMNVIDIKPLHV
jgi:WYL_2, Sm-like SH3 beta-barrel fold